MYQKAHKIFSSILISNLIFYLLVLLQFCTRKFLYTDHKRSDDEVPRTQLNQEDKCRVDPPGATKLEVTTGCAGHWQPPEQPHGAENSPHGVQKRTAFQVCPIVFHSINFGYTVYQN